MTLTSINAVRIAARTLAPEGWGTKMPLSVHELETLRSRLRALRSQVGGAVSDRLHRHGLDQHDDAALERVATGEYGCCVDCGDDIARERLIANPAAARCTECQERSERAALVARRTRA